MTIFSIITPVYNCELFISEAIESVAASTFQDYEHIIVNDGSTDNTSKVVANSIARLPPENQKKIHIISQENLGEASAINRAWVESVGEFILVLNADDKIATELLAESHQIMKARPDVVVTYPDWEVINALGGTKKRVETQEFSQKRMVRKFECIPGPGAVIRRKAIEGSEIRNPALRYLSDFESWLRLSLKGDFKRIPRFLASWRHLETNMTSQSVGLGWSEEALAVASELVKITRVPGQFSLHRSAKFGEATALILAAHQAIWDARVPGFNFLHSAIRKGIKLCSPRLVLEAAYVYLILIKKSLT